MTVRNDRGYILAARARRMVTDSKANEFIQPDGSFDFVAFFAAATGKTKAELEWGNERYAALIAEGMKPIDATRRIREESKTEPWKKG